MIADAATVRILLIEDHAIFRAGVRLLLESAPGLVVVGEAASGEAGLQLIRELPGVDVIIVDLVLPGIGGL